MINLPWFRFYVEAVDDPKLKLLAFEDRWHYVALLCCKGQGILDKEQDITRMRRQVAVKLGVDLRTLDEIERRLAAEDLIEPETLQPLQWDKRQFKSDSSADRTRAWRERNKDGAGAPSPRRHGDGLDTDTDDLEANASKSRGAGRGKHEYTEDFEHAWSLYPKRPGMNKLDTFKAWNARLKSAEPDCTPEQMIAGTKAYASLCRALQTEPRFIKQPATFFGPACHFLDDHTTPPPRAVGSAGGGAREQRSSWFSQMTRTGNNGEDNDFIDVPARQVG